MNSHPRSWAAKICENGEKLYLWLLEKQNQSCRGAWWVDIHPAPFPTLSRSIFQKQYGLILLVFLSFQMLDDTSGTSASFFVMKSWWRTLYAPDQIQESGWSKIVEFRSHSILLVALSPLVMFDSSVRAMWYTHVRAANKRTNEWLIHAYVVF